MGERTRRSRKLALACLAAMGAGLAGLSMGSPSSAQEISQSLIGGGGAEGVHVQVDIPKFLVVEKVEVGAPQAQASLDTQGNSSSFAGLPYPGDAVANIFSVPSVLLNTSIPFTTPGYVFAQAPVTPSAETQDPSGIYQLKATASNEQAFGRAALEGGSGSIASGFHAQSTVTTDGQGGMKVLSESVAQGIDIGGVLRIGSIRSRSTTTYKAGDKDPETDTEFTIDAVSILGVRVGLSDKGLVLGNQTLQLPVGNLIASLSNALKGAGVSIRFDDAETIEGGGVAKGLEISVTRHIPIQGNPLVTLTYTFGRASSFIDVAPAIGGAGNSGEGASGGAAPADAGSAPLSGGAEAPSAGTGGDVGLSPTPASTPASPSLPSAGARVGKAKPVLLARDIGGAAQLFYLVLALGGAVGAVGSGLWGWKGARASWIR